MVNILRLNLIAESASSLDMPMASSTCDASLDPVTQAEPEDRAKVGQAVIISLASTCLKLI
ncbi:hypothetical protein D3C77_772270 [compost metagenome]